MDIRSLCAAAVVAVGVGSAADAATIEAGRYRVELTLTENVWFCYMDCSEPQPEVAPYRGLALGETVRGVLELLTSPDDYLNFVLSWNGGKIASRPDFFYGDLYSGYEDSSTGESIEIAWQNGMLTGSFFDYADDIDWTQNAVIDFTGTPAPIPLPATAALLPIGIGALAMMRRRRRIN